MRTPEDQAFINSVPVGMIENFKHETFAEDFITSPSAQLIFANLNWINVGRLKDYIRHVQSPANDIKRNSTSTLSAIKVESREFSWADASGSQLRRSRLHLETNSEDGTQVHVLLDSEDEEEIEGTQFERELTAASDLDADGSSVASDTEEYVSHWPGKSISGRKDRNLTVNDGFTHADEDWGLSDIECSSPDLNSLPQRASRSRSTSVEIIKTVISRKRDRSSSVETIVPRKRARSSSVEVLPDSPNSTPGSIPRYLVAATALLSGQTYGSTQPRKLSRDQSAVERVFNPSPTKWIENDLHPRLVTTTDWFYITKDTKVKQLEYIHPKSDLPSVYPVHEVRTAFIVDMDDKKFRDLLKHGKGYTLDAQIKKADQDSWSGGTVDKSHPYIWCAFFGPKYAVLMKFIKCRRSRLKCKGGYACELVPQEVWLTPRRGTDTTLRDQHLADVRERRLAEHQQAVHRLLSFVSLVRQQKCPLLLDDGEPCGGKPGLRKFKNGSKHFIGCSRYNGSKGHLFVAIDAAINVEHLRQVLTTDTLPAELQLDDESTSTCSKLVPNSTGLKGKHQCPFSHTVDGRQYTANIIHHKCDAYRIVYIPEEEDIQTVIIVYDAEKPHLHPVPLTDKVPLGVRIDYEKCIKSGDIPGATPHKVDNAPSTKLILGGKTPAQFHSALGSDAKKRRIVTAVKKDLYPNGKQLPGVSALFQTEKTFPEGHPSRYIRSIVETPTGNVISTCNAELLEKIHETPTIQVDMTYKRVKGAPCEWEATMWDSASCRAITIFRGYSDRHDQLHFKLLCDGLQDAVLSLTGRPLRFKGLHEGGTLVAIGVDLEAAQALGIGESIFSRLSDDAKALVGNARNVPLYTLKACQRHVKSAILDFEKSVTPKQFKRLMGFLDDIKSQDDLDKFTEFVYSLEINKITSWWNHKINEGTEWVLAAIVGPPFSHISEEDWRLVDNTTNINEGQHHYTNRHTGTGLPILEAIETAKRLDTNTADEIRISLASGTLKNNRNELIHRQTRTVQRSAKSAKKRETKDEVSELDALLEEQLESRRASQQRTKELKEQRELLLASSAAPGSSSSGRVPARPMASSSSQSVSARQVASSSGRVRDTAQKQKSVTPVTDGSATAAVSQTDHQSLLYTTGNHSHQIGFSYHHNDGAWQAQGAPMFYPPGSNIHYEHGAEVPRQSLTPGTSFEMQDWNMGTHRNSYLANYNADASQYYYQ